MTAEKGEAEALDLLMKIAASGSTSRMYRSLVVNQKLASSAGGWYSGAARDSGKISVYAVPGDGVAMDKLEAGIDAVLADMRAKGVSQEELDRAKKSYLAEYVYESDNQASLARRYGWSLTVGRTVQDIEEWPERIAKVTLDDLQKGGQETSRCPPLGHRNARAGAGRWRSAEICRTSKLPNRT